MRGLGVPPVRAAPHSDRDPVSPPQCRGVRRSSSDVVLPECPRLLSGVCPAVQVPPGPPPCGEVRRSRAGAAEERRCHRKAPLGTVAAATAAG